MIPTRRPRRRPKRTASIECNDTQVPGPLGGAAMARPFPSAEKLGSMCVIAFWGTLRRPSWLAARPSPQQLVRVAWIHVLAWRTTEIPHPTSVVYVCDFGTPRLTPPRPSGQGSASVLRSRSVLGAATSGQRANILCEQARVSRPLVAQTSSPLSPRSPRPLPPQ